MRLCRFIGGARFSGREGPKQTFDQLLRRIVPKDVNQVPGLLKEWSRIVHTSSKQQRYGYCLQVVLYE